MHLLSSVNYNQDGINVERVKINKRNLVAGINCRHRVVFWVDEENKQFNDSLCE